MISIDDILELHDKLIKDFPVLGGVSDYPPADADQAMKRKARREGGKTVCFDTSLKCSHCR